MTKVVVNMLKTRLSMRVHKKHAHFRVFKQCKYSKGSTNTSYSRLFATARKTFHFSQTSLNNVGENTLKSYLTFPLIFTIIVAWLLETKSTMACVYNKMALYQNVYE